LLRQIDPPLAWGARMGRTARCLKRARCAAAAGAQEQFKQWVNGLLNISVPIILSKRSLHSHEAFSCGGSHVVKFKVYKDLKAFSHLAVRSFLLLVLTFLSLPHVPHSFSDRQLW
jgi:hypothetical protein